MNPYTGNICKHSHNNVSYIGCTVDIEKGKDNHTNNKTNKFGCVLKQHGYSNSDFGKSDTIGFSEMSELYDIEDVYITKFDSIKNRYKTRRNCKEQL